MPWDKRPGFPRLLMEETTNTPSYTVATLPSAPSFGVGARAVVTDALVVSFNSIVVGGGANTTPVYYDGSNWRIG